MSCNGLCKRYKAKGNHIVPRRYKEGQKRRSVWEIFIKWNENSYYCPCCRYKLRTRSFRGFRMRKNKEKKL
jgi:hypothetical protein